MKFAGVRLQTGRISQILGVMPPNSDFSFSLIAAQSQNYWRYPRNIASVMWDLSGCVKIPTPLASSNDFVGQRTYQTFIHCWTLMWIVSKWWSGSRQFLQWVMVIPLARVHLLTNSLAPGCPRSPVARPLGRHVQYSTTCAVFRWFEVRFEPPT